MNDKQKYKEALKKLQEALAPCEDGCKISGLTRDCLENIFPELKESEDEKIRKTLIEYIKGIKSWNYFLGISKEQMIAWLEKQGEKSTNIDIDKMVMEYSQTKDGDFGLPVNCMLRAYRKGINDALFITLLKKDFGS